MMIKKFLEQETSLLSLCVVLFHLFMTSSITLLIVLTFFFNYDGSSSILNFLFLDIAFITSHLLLRLGIRLYKKKKAQASSARSYRQILITHSTVSILVLPLTWILLRQETSTFFIVMTLLLWWVSCLSGIFFFAKKYIHPVFYK
jgi:chromate transport protein ChrA